MSEVEHFFSSDILSSIALFGFLPFLTAAAEGKVSMYFDFPKLQNSKDAKESFLER